MGDLSRARLELSRQDRMSTGARLGKGPTGRANTNQNAAQERSSGKGEELSTCYATRTEHFTDPNSRLDNCSFPHGDSDLLGVKAQRYKMNALDQDSECCNLISEPVSEIIEQVKYDSTETEAGYSSRVEGLRSMKLGADDTSTCTDRQEHLYKTVLNPVSGSHRPANRHQNAAGEDNKRAEGTASYLATQVFSDPNPRLHNRLIADGEVDLFGQRRNPRTILDHDDDRSTLSLVSELMESMEQVSPAPTQANCKAQTAGEEDFLLELDMEFLCSNCQENPRSPEDIVSNEDDFESCADNSP